MNGDDGSDDCLNQGLPGRKDANQLHNGDHLKKLSARWYSISISDVLEISSTYPCLVPPKVANSTQHWVGILSHLFSHLVCHHVFTDPIRSFNTLIFVNSGAVAAKGLSARLLLEPNGWQTGLVVATLWAYHLVN